ncbi:3-deoxy-D-manno-octulosonic acid transferase [Acuticoccus kandeliae]|uniref:3-deoxy-D-manno-octulosonic acid transferase n=1 Tax=Acuticoccus kandeliae TaxID=2073160 RepID=UPI000E3B8F65|nr:3-deoxy-D-manno-octulosonic acid transferase [Acuticoccus kandeliae]
MSGRGGAVWSLYDAAGRLASPLARPYLRRRATRGKEDAARLDEKRGIPSRTPFATRPIWVHAVSVGESVAALSVAETLVGWNYPVLVTTATPTAAGRVAAHEGPALVHQYAPLDALPFVNRFLAGWRPQAALFTESEVWPATLGALARHGVPRAHVNARLSDRSFARWQRRPALAAPLFSTIDIALAQSETQAARFRALGTPEAVATGQLKFDAAPPVADPATVAALEAAIGGRPVWLAASTHPGEDEIVIAAHARLAARIPDLVTIIAPRHPERAAAISALVPGGIPRRSAGAAPAPGLYLADTFGEMGALFRVAPIVFLGASLVPLGGHNPAEPAAHDAALLTGPAHGEMFAPFLAADAARIVADADALAAAVEALVSDPAARAAMAGRAGAVLETERGALRRTMDALSDWFARAGVRAEERR